MNQESRKAGKEFGSQETMNGTLAAAVRERSRLPLVTNTPPQIGQYQHYYSHRAFCCNCGKHSNIYIRKGTPVSSVGVTCERCECKIEGA